MIKGKYIRTEETLEKLRKSLRGRRFSDEHKRNISLAKTGKKMPPSFGARVSERIAGEGNPFFGKKHSLETRKKLSEIKMNQQSWNWKGDRVKKRALHTWIKRRLLKPEICPVCKERPALDLANISQEYKRDLADWEWLCRSCHFKKYHRRLGRKSYTRTDEYKKRMSNILKGRTFSKETIKKMSESAKRRFRNY